MHKDHYLKEHFGLGSDDPLIEDFSCFYDASLIQPAHMYLTKGHLCFHVHGNKTIHYEKIPWAIICDLKKKNTAKVIPNAVAVITKDHDEYFFAFVNRHHCYKSMHRMWLGKDHNQSCHHEHDHSHHTTLSELHPEFHNSESNHPTNLKDSVMSMPEYDVIEANTEIPIEEVFEMKRVLGTGAFSVVKLAEHKKTHETFAIKVVDKDAVAKEKKEMLEREVDILKRIQHKNIVAVKEIYETEKYLYLVMELATGGELFDSIVKRGKYSESDAALLVHQVVSAINYLHSKGIVHRDLKPENLLLATKDVNSPIKIADFGLSKIMEASAVLITACGTPGYVAPEVLKGEGYQQEVDVWSIGVIMYILLCGFPPFWGENNSKLFEKIMVGNFSFPSPYWDKVSPSAKDLIRRMLVVDPKQRLSSKEILVHPWILGHTTGLEDLTGALEELKKTNSQDKVMMLATASTARMALG